VNSSPFEQHIGKYILIYKIILAIFGKGRRRRTTDKGKGREGTERLNDTLSIPRRKVQNHVICEGPHRFYIYKIYNDYILKFHMRRGKVREGENRAERR